ncbi:MAG: very short patch repair endonuclease [Terriglobales bacterium]
MTDTFTKTQRSQIMRAVRSRGTEAEKNCERLLRTLKLSFRRHVAYLPGKPDFLLKSSRVAVFVNGCFWHAHKSCKNAALPRSNVDYWIHKIEGNRRRDRRAADALRKAGWRTAVIWECKLKNPESIANRLLRLATAGRKRKKLR